jgi:Xaa-Pro aminopeptidase
MGKINKVRQQFKELNIDSILITNPYNRRYISNFTGTAGVVLITEEKAYFITDFRYTEQAEKQAIGFEIVQHKGLIQDEVKRLVEENGVKRLGFEENDLTYAQYLSYQKGMKAEFIPVSNVVEKIRLIKTEDEIKILKEAADIADAAFKHIIEFIRPGLTEKEVSNELEFFMRKCGADSSSFDIIVASGARSALPHGVASDKIIEKGDMVTLDYGAFYKGYISDITRTIAVGEPSNQLKEIYQIVYDAQMKAMNEIRPGLTGKQADAIARDYITSKGYGQNFGHSTGHGIGLEVHEGPSLSMRSNLVLEKGMVVTVEPGIYLPGVGGVRIEDDIVLTDDHNETLTHSTKELLIL